MSQLEFNAKINLTSANTDLLVENLQHLIYQFPAVNNAPITVVSRLLPFPVHDQRRSSVIAVNIALEHTHRTNPNVLYWKHRWEIWNSTRKFYLHDNVHLNSISLLTYSRSVHRAVKKAVQMLSSFGHWTGVAVDDISSSSTEYSTLIEWCDCAFWWMKFLFCIWLKCSN